MARPKSIILPSDPMLLQAMLDGLGMQRQRVEDQIASVRSAMGGGRKAAAPAPSVSEGAAPAAAAPRSKRILSAAARARIAAAQKKRWAAFRKDKKAAE